MTWLLQTCIRVENATQFQLCQSHHLCILRTFVLQWELIVVQHYRVQATLESIKHPGVLLEFHEATRVWGLHLRTTRVRNFELKCLTESAGTPVSLHSKACKNKMYLFLKLSCFQELPKLHEMKRLNYLKTKNQVYTNLFLYVY